MRSKVAKHVSAKFVFVMGIIFIIAYILINVAFGVYFRLQTNGNSYLEALVFYSPQDLYDLLNKYGQHGREIYILSSLLMDFIFPLQYSVFFASLAYIIYRKLFNKATVLKLIVYLGIALCLSDWIENIFLITVVANYPGELFAFAWLAAAMTLLKSSLTVLFIVISIVGGISLVVKRSCH